MDINLKENTAVRWDKLPAEQSMGLTGFVTAKTATFPTFRIRQLIFSENYEADHWCNKGHIIFVVSGELIVEQQNGASIKVSARHSLVLGDNTASHKVKTEVETTVLIVD